MTFGVYNGSVKTIRSTAALNDGNWHHVVGTLNGGTGVMKLYVDGVAQGSGLTGVTGGDAFAAGYWRVGGDELVGWPHVPASDYINATIDEAAVERSVVGHGSRGSFAVADAMCEREPAQALGLLRGVLETGSDPIMVLGALVYRIRSLVAVAGKVDPREVGLRISAGQARRLQGVRRNFGPGELTAAVRTLADADVELKSGELPPELVIERAVVRIATAT